MSSRFHPQLLNDPFGDPGLYIELMFERRAILFDLGDLGRVSARRLLRVSDVFVSQMHLDHFVGFDQLLRLQLGRRHTLRVYGPPGMVDAVRHKLAAYTWNLIGKEDGLTVIAAELSDDGRLHVVEMAGHDAFRPGRQHERAVGGGLVHLDQGFRVRTVAMDHGIPSMAYALEEDAHVNILKNRVDALGLVVGPWLGDLKAAILDGAPDDTVIRADAREDRETVRRDLVLGEIRDRLTTTTPGVRIAYVVDTAPTQANIDRAVALAKGATVLFIEAAFLHDDIELARERHHLTARIAGEIARAAGVGRLVTLHHSGRYEDRPAALAAEAKAAFRGAR